MEQLACGALEEKVNLKWGIALRMGEINYYTSLKLVILFWIFLRNILKWYLK